MNVKMILDRVLIKGSDPEEKLKSGIIIPDTAKEKPTKGQVISIGPGKKEIPTTAKVGDTVLYGKYSGTEVEIEVEIEDEKYLIMREDDILAILSTVEN